VQLGMIGQEEWAANMVRRYARWTSMRGVRSEPRNIKQLARRRSHGRKLDEDLLRS